MNNKNIVVKIGLGDSMATEEVRRNITGYKEMRRIGAESIMPRNIQIIQMLGLPVIIMEDLGVTFKEQVKSEEVPLLLFKNLASGLMDVYTKTLYSGSRSVEFMQEMKDCLLRQYSRHLLPAMLINQEALQKVRNIDLKQYVTDKFCFGVWDFTPEDVFIKGPKLYYIDPPPKILGIPIVDIACFAGVARDVYNLPASDGWARTLFACNIFYTKKSFKRFLFYYLDLYAITLQKFLNCARFNQPFIIRYANDIFFIFTVKKHCSIWFVILQSKLCQPPNTILIINFYLF
ncbi:hypothetical protein L6252_01775 [Candidatus Parcubacteria bacterium]|nr:hypothetical protein [Candidatus Parcubacteria bacterium]